MSNLVEIKQTVSISDELRSLADRIDAGAYDDVKSVSYVLEYGNNSVATGYCGSKCHKEELSYFLLSKGMRSLEGCFCDEE